MAADDLQGGISPREAGHDFQIKRAVVWRFSHVQWMGPEGRVHVVPIPTPHRLRFGNL